MRLPFEHTRGYHEWESMTPVLDAVAAVVGMISIIIGGFAALSLWFSLRDGEAGSAVASAAFFVGIGAANGIVDLLRRWRRHHY